MYTKTVLEISHVRTQGVAQDLCRYLSVNFRNFTFIEHPFKSSIDVLGSTGTRIYNYDNGKTTKTIYLQSPHGPELIFWLRDIWQLGDWCDS